MLSPAVRLLLAANLRSHVGRFVAASIAISFATTLLLVALIGQRVVRDQAPVAAKSLLAADQIHLAATDTVHPFIDEGVLDALRSDSRIEHLSTAITARAVDLPGLESGELDTESFFSLEGAGMGGWIPGRRDAFLAWQDDRPRGEVAKGRWPSPVGSDPIEIAVPAVVWGQSVDSWRLLESDTGSHAAKIVGILPVDMGMVASPQGIRLAARQISPAAAEKLAGGPRPPSDARVFLRRAEDKAAFLADWRPRLKDFAGRLELWDSVTLEQAGLHSPATESARLAVQTAVLLASACVVCIALSVQGNAVRERAAQSSLLRCLGATRWSLAQMVLVEAVALALVSVLAAVVLVGAVMAGLAACLPMLRVPSAPDAASVVIAGAVTLLGILVGAAWPAIVASRRLPGDFAVEQGDPDRAARLANRAAVAGVVIAAMVATSIYVTPAQSFLRAELLTWLGVPSLALTALLLTPLTIRLTSKLLVWPVAQLTRTVPLVLADQVAADGARSAGSVVAIAVGLGGFIWMLCWGASMLESFIIDPAMPRWLVSVHPYGLEREEAGKLLSEPAFETYHPLTLVDTHLNEGGEAIPTLVMGIDIERSLVNRRIGLPFDFVAGEREEAIAALRQTGDACLVSAWYAASHGTQLGDQLTIAAPSESGRAERTYYVAGIVELKGWRMATKLNKVRLLGDKHTAMLVLSADKVRRDFPVAYANFLLGDTINKSGGPTRFHNELAKDEAYARSRAEREAIESAVARVVDLSQPIEHRPDGVTAVTAEKRITQVDDLDRTRASLRGEWGGAAVQRMGQAPLLALALSLLSVSGALVGSFHARSRELGVLRSCGLTRFGLVRLAIAEALLLGAAAIPIAAFLGGVGAAMMLEVASVVGYRLDFAGIQPELLVPWSWLWPGLVVTAVVCCLAALWAAYRVGRTPPASMISAVWRA